MEKEHFAATEPDAWWLVARDIEYRIEASRRSLGEALGWSDPLWYTEAVKLEELYRRLESSDYRLLVDLDLLAYDDQKVEWLTAATTAVSPVATREPEKPASTAAPQPAAVSASPKPKLFATRATEPPKDAPASPADASARRAGGAKPSPFAKKQEPASEPSVTTAPARDEKTVQVDAAVHEVLTELSGDGAAPLAGELGLTAEEAADLAHDPDFERMVAEEVAKLVAQRSE